MADQNGNRGSRGQRQTQSNRKRNPQNLQGQPQTYYSYTYGLGYYDPFTGQETIDVYGPYTGVGPANYKRPDSRIQDDVNNLLWIDGQVDATDIETDVKNGVVTLKGTVPNRRMKRLAEDLAFSVPGVDDVQNQLQVQKQTSQLGQGQQHGRLGQGQKQPAGQRSQQTTPSK